MTKALSEFRVLSFDCYGTLIDWESGIWKALQPLLQQGGTVHDRARVLEAYSEIEPVIESSDPKLPYPEVLARAHQSLAKRLGVSTNKTLDEAFGASVPEWPVFADSHDALVTLDSRFRLVILSNVDRAGFAASARKLGIEFEAVCTAEDVGSYKPDPANFEYLIDRVRDDFGIGPEQILHVAQSLFHDHVPAIDRGLATAWIDRQNLAGGGGWGATASVEIPSNLDFTFASLTQLAEAALGNAPA